MGNDGASSFSFSGINMKDKVYSIDLDDGTTTELMSLPVGNSTDITTAMCGTATKSNGEQGRSSQKFAMNTLAS